MAASQLLPLYQQLQKAFNGQPCQLAACKTLLAQLKVGLVQTGLLVPRKEHSIDDLTIARDILEMGAIWSVRSKDVPSFDRYFSQLQVFYKDFSNVLPQSPRENPITGLNLIRLLTQNRIADFHTTLEALPAEIIYTNPFLKHPVNLEQWLMEGSYSKVWAARNETPAEEYKYFVDSLMGTIRSEIATCEEAAYRSLPIKDACTLLFFSTRSELVAFAQQRGWEIDIMGEQVRFATKGEEKLEIPKRKLIASSLTYARELEQIV